MVMTHRPVTAEDAEVVAALMSRIAADHATGFELSASEVRELLADYPGAAVEGPRGRAGSPKRPHLPDGWLGSRELGDAERLGLVAAELDVA